MGLFAANKPGYVVKPSIIVPEWSGATPGVWTMDYASALANAKADGKWTLMLYSGMWWCPHCQPLEEHVLTKPAFSNYVAECGYYTTVLDNPYRDGYSNWCWLYETNYVENVAHLTMEEALQEIDRRYAVQESYALPGATEYNISNWNGTATITYHKVGYPTIIVIRPDGRPAGRFGFSKSQPAETAIAYVTNLIEQVKRHDDWDEIDDFWQTTQTVLPVPEQIDEVVVHGEHVLSTRDSADWFKIEISDDVPVRWTFLFDSVEGLPSATLSVSVYDDPISAPLSSGEIDFVSSSMLSVDFPSAGTYYLKVGAKLTELVGYRLSYLYGTGRMTEFGAPTTLVATDEEYAMPTLRDMDGDGLLDLLVGVKEPLASEKGVLTGYVGRVRIYRNMGTAESPRFGGYSNLSVNGAVLEDALEKNTGCQGLKAEFGDFDGDGYDDLFVGHHWGELDVYWGTAEPNVYFGTTRILARAGDMNGYRTVPCAHDFDDDGRVELYVGRIDGTFAVFTCDTERNVTDAGTLDDGAGGVLTVQALRSAPAFADLDGDGLLDLVSGDTDGDILYFPARGLGKWSAQQEKLVVGTRGSRSRIALADVDGDGSTDAIVGYADGTVALMTGAPRTEMLCEPAAEGYMPGARIEPIDVVLDPPMATASITAAGLPAGLSLKNDRTSGAYWIEGTPTKSGTNNVTLKLSCTTGGIKRESVLTVPIIVLPLPVLAVDVESIDGGTGRVAGAGAYLVGKMAALSATPESKPKSVFGGWYSDGEPLETCGVDYRTPRIQLEVPPEPETRLTAKFHAQEEDTLVSVFVPDQTLRAGEKMDDVPIQVASLSFPTVTAKGLPAGVKLDAKALKLTGTPAKPGDYVVTFAAKNVSKVSAEWTSRITVLNFASSEIGPLEERYVFTAGIAETNIIDAIIGCAVSGLPSGLKMDKDSGAIYGTPNTPGTWLATFTKKVGKVTEKASAWFYVAGAGDALDGSDGIPVIATISSGDEETVATNGTWRIDLTQGVAWSCSMDSVPTMLDSPVTFTVKGLPTGLKFDAKTGVIYGAPTKVSSVDARTNVVKPALVTIVAANKAKWKGALELEIYVAARPAWATGTYDGMAAFGGMNGLFTATVAESGAVSGKYTIGDKSYMFKAPSLAAENDDGSFCVEAVATIAKNNVVTNRLVLTSSVYESAAATGIAEDMLTGRMMSADGEVEGFSVTNCYQNLWARKDAQSYRLPVFASGAQKSLAVMRGDLVLRFSAKGKVTIAGKLDGKSVSGSCQLITTDFGIPSCLCDTSFYYNGLLPIALPRQDYFSIVTFMGSSGTAKITGKDEDYDLELTSDDQVVE